MRTFCPPVRSCCWPDCQCSDGSVVRDRLRNAQSIVIAALKLYHDIQVDWLIPKSSYILLRYDNWLTTLIFPSIIILVFIAPTLCLNEWCIICGHHWIDMVQYWNWRLYLGIDGGEVSHLQSLRESGLYWIYCPIFLQFTDTCTGTFYGSWKVTNERQPVLWVYILSLRLQ